jgi:hypothetical protein
MVEWPGLDLLAITKPIGTLGLLFVVAHIVPGGWSVFQRGCAEISYSCFFKPIVQFVGEIFSRGSVLIGDESHRLWCHASNLDRPLESLLDRLVNVVLDMEPLVVQQTVALYCSSQQSFHFTSTPPYMTGCKSRKSRTFLRRELINSIVMHSSKGTQAAHA